MSSRCSSEPASESSDAKAQLATRAVIRNENPNRACCPKSLPPLSCRCGSVARAIRVVLLPAVFDGSLVVGALCRRSGGGAPRGKGNLFLVA